MTGSAALDLASLSEGPIDASITLSNNPWDMAAGVILAREAGAMVTDLNGTSYTTGSQTTIAFAPALRPELLGLVSTVVMDTSR